ncbi:MAG: amidohydrolase family protein [Gemmatimonadota bacterium]
MKWITHLALALMTGTACAAAQDPGGVTVFRNVNVLTMQEEAALPAHAVIVAGGTITWVGAMADLVVPDGARLVEGGGRYLLPGLADMHVHMGGVDVPLFLANGITTVRELNGAPFHLALRDSIRAGQRVGPRMFVTSALLAGAEQPWRHLLVSDAAAAARIARESAAAGYDALKVYDALSPQAYRALVEAGAATGLPLVGHIPRDVGLAAVLAAGQRTIEHSEQIMYATVGHEPAPDRIPEITADVAASGVWVVPTLAAQRILTQSGTADYNARFEVPEIRFVDEGTLAWWRTLRAPDGTPPAAPDDPRSVRRNAFYGFQRELVAALHAAGVPFLVGTDTPNPLLIPGYSIHLEFEALTGAGLRPIDVLRAATREPARFMGQEGEWGVVVPGAAADLVLVEANPLEDMGTLKRPAGVMVGGRWLERAALEAMVAERG